MIVTSFSPEHLPEFILFFDNFTCITGVEFLNSGAPVTKIGKSWLYHFCAFSCHPFCL